MKKNKVNKKKKYGLQTRKPLNKLVRRNRQKISEKIEKRYQIIIGIIIFIILILAIYLFNIQVIQNDKYQKKVISLTEKTIYGESSPRGRIYDRNHKLIVTNRPQKVIYYKKPQGISIKEELQLAYKLSKMIELEYSDLNEINLKEYWIKKNSSLARKKITDKEWKKSINLCGICFCRYHITGN